LMANAFSLIHRNVIECAPIARVLMQLFFLRRHRRDHVVNEQSVPARVLHTCESKLIFHLFEDDIGVAGKVVGHHKIGLGLYVVPRVDADLATGTGQYFFCDGRTQNNALQAMATDASARDARPFKCLPQSSHGVERLWLVQHGPALQ